MNQLKFKTLLAVVSLVGVVGMVLVWAGLSLPGEGVKLWRTSTIKARLVEYQQAGMVIKAHPLFGIGFNNIREYRAKFLLEPTKTHSLSWYSSTLANWLVTGGVTGLLIWLWWLGWFWREFNYPTRLSLLLWLFHAEFHSSFFYPWAILVFFITAGGLHHHRVNSGSCPENNSRS